MRNVAGLWVSSCCVLMAALAAMAAEEAPETLPRLFTTLEMMAQHDESRITPAAWAGPGLPATPPDRLACRTDIRPISRPDMHNDVRYKQLPPVPASIATCGRLNFSTPVQGAWMRGGGGVPEFVLSTCRLRDLSADEALTCFKGRHIVFVGDSTLRFQVLHLVDWLMRGEHRDPDNACQPGELLMDAQDGRWLPTYEDLTAALNQPNCVTTTCPRCVRSALGERWHFSFALVTGASVRISLYTVKTHITRHFVDTLQRILNASHPAQEPHADVLVLNAGIWLLNPQGELGRLPLGHFMHKYELIFHHARTLVNAQSSTPGGVERTRLVFKSTTTLAGQPDTVDGLTHVRAQDFSSWDCAWPTVEPLVKAKVLWYGWDYFDAMTPSRQGLALGMGKLDSHHLKAYANTMFNDLLLNIMC